MSEADIVPNVMMITSIASEESLASDRHTGTASSMLTFSLRMCLPFHACTCTHIDTHTDTDTDTNTHTHTHTHTHANTHTHTHTYTHNT